MRVYSLTDTDTPSPQPSPEGRGSRTIQRTWLQHLGYNLLRMFSRSVGVLVFGLRVEGRENHVPEGAALICSNHQSYFDPVLVGLTCDRRMNYLARDTLFKVPVLKHLIRFLDAIPIDREGSGLAGLKETLRRLKAGEQVLIFPEGTRTPDGEVHALKPGFCSVARRSKAPLVPVGFDGPFQAWPRTAKFPRPARVAVVIGEPIKSAEVEHMTDDELVAELGRRIRDCHDRARKLRE